MKIPILGMDKFKKLKLKISQNLEGKELSLRNKSNKNKTEWILYTGPKLEEEVDHYRKKIEVEFKKFLRKIRKSKTSSTTLLLLKVSR